MLCFVQLSSMSQSPKASKEKNQCLMKGENENSKSIIKPLKPKKMTIAFYLQNGVEVLDFAGPLEVFTTSGFQVFTV